MELLQELPASAQLAWGQGPRYPALSHGPGRINKLVSVSGAPLPTRAAAEWPRPGGKGQSPRNEERRDSEVSADG